MTILFYMCVLYKVYIHEFMNCVLYNFLYFVKLSAACLVTKLNCDLPPYLHAYFILVISNSSSITVTDAIHNGIYMLYVISYWCDSNDSDLGEPPPPQKAWGGRGKNVPSQKIGCFRRDDPPSTHFAHFEVGHKGT